MDIHKEKLKSNTWSLNEISKKRKASRDKIRNIIFKDQLLQNIYYHCHGIIKVFVQWIKFGQQRKPNLQSIVSKEIVVTKINFDISCQRFYYILELSPTLLKQISSNMKYEL